MKKCVFWCVFLATVINSEAALSKANAEFKQIKPVVQEFEAAQWKKCYEHSKYATVSGYQDHLDWLNARCLLEVLGQVPTFGSISDYQKALSRVNGMDIRDPSSTYLKEFMRLSIRLELEIAHRQVQAGKNREAYHTFERALLRSIQKTNEMGWSPPFFLSADLISDFSQLLTKMIKSKEIKKEVAEAWALRVMNLYPKKSADAQSLHKAFPEVSRKVFDAPTFEKFSQIYKAPDLDLDLFDQGWKLYLKKDWNEARKKWVDLVSLYPKSSQRFRALYWTGETLSKDGKASESEDLWKKVTQEAPLTYYAILAYWKLKKTQPELKLDPDASPLKKVNRDPYLTPLELKKLEHVEALLKEGLGLLAQNELQGLQARDHLSHEYLYYLASLHDQAHAHWSGFPVLGEIIQRHAPGAFSEEMVGMIFPQTRWELVREQAEGAKVDPWLFQSLIKQESAFDAQALSSSNAYGLSQLIYATALDIDPDLERKDLLDPKTNLRVGSKYLAQLIKKFDGNWFFSLSAYNWGPTAVARFYKDLKESTSISLNGLEFLESVPVRETREYTASILRNYFWYLKRMEMRELGSFEPFWVSKL